MRSARLMGMVVGGAMAVQAGALFAADAAAPASAVRYGMDIRIREEMFDDIPIKADPPGVTRNGKNDYFRFRTRAFVEGDLQPDITFRARAVNEFRSWNDPSMSKTRQASNYEFPDEVVLDNLYLDLKDLAGKKMDVRIGRQEMIYGTGKVMLEGTPGDGSRTIYFNAVKAVWKGIPDTTIDCFGVYQPGSDDYAMNTARRNLTVYKGSLNDVDESGAGVYLKNKTLARMPFEAYGIYKHVIEWDQAAAKDAKAAGGYAAPKYAWQSLDAAAGRVENGEVDSGTAGVRLMPDFGAGVKGNFEAAYQFGSQGDVDINAGMADGFVVYALPFAQAMKPAVDAGVYYLTGDDPKTKDNEAWDPLWARYPQFSELYVYSFDADMPAARWSNVMMPHVGVSCEPTARVKTSLAAAYLQAPEKDGPGGGDERGWLYKAMAEFKIAEGLMVKTGGLKDKLTGHLLVEALEPGDYYKVDDTAYFARWQLAYEF